MICKQCGSDFSQTVKNIRREYCSDVCRALYNSKKIKSIRKSQPRFIKCEWCQREVFTVRLTKFCCNECKEAQKKDYQIKLDLANRLEKQSAKMKCPKCGSGHYKPVQDGRTVEMYCFECDSYTEIKK